MDKGFTVTYDRLKKIATISVEWQPGLIAPCLPEITFATGSEIGRQLADAVDPECDGPHTFEGLEMVFCCTDGDEKFEVARAVVESDDWVPGGKVGVVAKSRCALSDWTDFYNRSMERRGYLTRVTLIDGLGLSVRVNVNDNLDIVSEAIRVSGDNVIQETCGMTEDDAAEAIEAITQGLKKGTLDAKTAASILQKILASGLLEEKENGDGGRIAGI